MIRRLSATGRSIAIRASAGPPLEGLFVRLANRLASGDEVAVLTYHRVAPPPADAVAHPGLLSASPEQLERQIAWLRRHARVLSMDELIRARAVRRLPARSVLLTFDDGYADFAEHAWPRLRAANLPVTLFLTTSAATPASTDVAAGFWWDRLYAALAGSSLPSVATAVGTVSPARIRRDPTSIVPLTQRLKALPHGRLLAAVDELVAAAGSGPGVMGRTAPAAMLDWPTIEQLAGEGVTLAPHTRTHPILTRLPLAEARTEVEGSRQELQRRVRGANTAVFAYPSGVQDEATAQMLDELGVELAFTTRRGMNRLGVADRLKLHRFNVGSRSSPGWLAAQLAWSRLRGQGRADVGPERRF